MGNIRLSYSDADNDGVIDILRNNVDVDGDGDNHDNEIREVKNYYPFGLLHQKEGGNVVNGGRRHPYGFNGVEENNSLGLNMLETPFRQYDPAIARWTSMDPVIHFSQSTYNGFDGNPVFWADPSGADSIYNFKTYCSGRMPKLPLSFYPYINGNTTH